MALQTLQREDLRQSSDFGDSRYPEWDRRVVPKVLPWVIWTIGFAAVCSVLYAISLHAVAGNSDSATVVLQGQAMGHGNFLLRGWTLPYDSYWTIDALAFMFCVLAVGVRTDLFNFVPALLAAFVVLIGVVIATEKRRGAAAVFAGGVVVGTLGLPTYTFSTFYLDGPAHVGTVLWCLMAFVALRTGKFGIGWLLAVLFLATATLGDLQAAFVGITVAFVAGLLAMLRSRNWHSGSSEVTAAIAAAGLAAATRALASHSGAFTIQSRQPTAQLSQVGHNFGHLWSWETSLLGARGSLFGLGGVPKGLAEAHVVVIAVLITGLLGALFGLVRGLILGDRSSADRAGEERLRPWRLDDLLLIAFFSSVAIFIALTLTNDVDYYRYLVATVIFATILAGRLIGRAVAAVRSRAILAIAAALASCVVAAFAIATVINLRSASQPRPYSSVASFLKEHGLHDGLGDYWSASVLTVATGTQVTVRPVLANSRHHLVPYGVQVSRDWYAGRTFDFLVYDTAVPWGDVNLRTAQLSFGTAANDYSVGTYRVLVWSHPVTFER